MSGDAGGPAPVLLLGGQENTLSVVRSLGSAGVPVSISARPSCHALRSRHAVGRYVVPSGRAQPEYWDTLLLREPRPELQRALVWPCSDVAIEFLAQRHEELAPRYVLDGHVPEQQLALLDKERTLELARDAGVPAPRHWTIPEPGAAERLAGELDFPVIVKPLHSHRFQRVLPGKVLTARDHEELRAALSAMEAHGLEAMITEWIPGPDSLLNSYYTFIDRNGEKLFHFTKRILRRSPPVFGMGSYHVTEWLPETAEMAQRFLDGIGFRGLANVEFKRDPRDGRLKIIECNARFTAAQELLVRAGVDVADIMYRYFTNAPPRPVGAFGEHLHLWHPEEDFRAFRALRESDGLTFAAWLRSVARPQTFPFWSWRDPVPAFSRFGSRLRSRLSGRQTRYAGGGACA